jgi:glycine dehydrogenase
MSFPVAGTFMIEPTESESIAELDDFCDALIAVRAEVDKVAAGEWDAADNPLRNAPHTAEMLLREEWHHPYRRDEGGYPRGLGIQGRAKYWPPVRRIDQAYGDRHLVSACQPPEAYE